MIILARFKKFGFTNAKIQKYYTDGVGGRARVGVSGGEREELKMIMGAG